MNIRGLHNEAMRLAALADFQKIRKSKDNAMSLYERSYELEREAAMNARNDNVGEPSVSILLRSAASLAMNCMKFGEAKELIDWALDGKPPLEIAEELKILLENINSCRPLEVKNAKA